MQDELERGRARYATRDWTEAYDSLTAADRAEPLSPEDLELLATSAFMLGRDDEYVSALERAHHLYLEAGETLRSVRCAIWLGLNLTIRGEVGPAGGWLGRAQRILDREQLESAERGYLLMPLAFRHEGAGEFEEAAAITGEAAAIAERFGDIEGFALASQAQGYMLIKAGRVREGLALLDQAMVAMTSRELSPIVTGIVYCGVILACEEVYELRRARDWTAALTRWCEEQPDIVAFTGRCLVHRAQIMQLRGAWPDALDETQKARARFELQSNPAVGVAWYRQAEILRLQGEFAAAEECYREASREGWEPQPGLAQLRLAQGNVEAAAAAIRRATGETAQPLKRAALLPANVEIALASGDVEWARTACRELEEIAGRFESAMLAALVSHARGSVQLADGDAADALVSLREAVRAWHELGAPYEAARGKVLIGLACRALGDQDAAELELDAARAVLSELGARPDVTRVDALAGAAPPDTHGLSSRELEVLRLLAAGKSNKEIAASLVISEHTVARHVQNIFAKLDVSSRAAAGAFAHQHDLV
jgi:ATP/maltotriose-dependent transcriptional regulator MalT